MLFGRLRLLTVRSASDVPNKTVPLALVASSRGILNGLKGSLSTYILHHAKFFIFSANDGETGAGSVRWLLGGGEWSWWASS